MVCGPSHVNECRALGDGMPDKESMLTGLMVYHIQLPRCSNTLRLIGCPHVLSMWQRVTKSLQKGAVVFLARDAVDFGGVALFGLSGYQGSAFGSVRVGVIMPQKRTCRRM